jgi:hypothetical protein
MGWLIGMVVSLVLIIIFVVLLARRERRMNPEAFALANSSANTAALGGWAAPYILCYALYALLVGLGAVVFFVWPDAIKLLLALLGMSWEASRFLYVAGVTLAGLVAFAGVLAAEPYLRSGVDRHLLLPRFLRAALALGAFGLLGLVVRWTMLAAL